MNCSRRLHLPICLAFQLHFAPSCLPLLPFLLDLKYSWLIEKNILLILLTFLLPIITSGSSILRVFLSQICSDTGGLSVTPEQNDFFFCLKHGAAYLSVSLLSLCPRYFSKLLPQVLEQVPEHITEQQYSRRWTVSSVNKLSQGFQYMG